MNLNKIEKALALIKSRRSWTSFAWSKDSNGNKIYPKNKNACRFSLDGALIKVNIPISDWYFLEKCLKEYTNGKYRYVVQWNDHMGHRKVVEFLEWFLYEKVN